MEGRIVKQISNLYTVLVDEDSYDCIARGKFRKMNLSPCCGDIVRIENNVIEEIITRRNLLDRPTVANVDVALIVTSIKKPDLSLTLLDKTICIVKNKDIEPVIVFTKLDLMNKEDKKNVKNLVKYYNGIGIKVFDNKHLNKLLKYLKKKLVVLTGQTGAGKSSILNKLDKNLKLETKPISDALGRGVHTTRHTEIYEIKNVYFVDTPGFSSLDITDMSIEDLQKTFNEFNGSLCEYSNCTHIKESGCGVKKLLENGKILPSRYLNYGRFLKEINENSRKLFK